MLLVANPALEARGLSLARAARGLLMAKQTSAAYDTAHSVLGPVFAAHGAGCDGRTLSGHAWCLLQVRSRYSVPSYSDFVVQRNAYVVPRASTSPALAHVRRSHALPARTFHSSQISSPAQKPDSPATAAAARSFGFASSCAHAHDVPVAQLRMQSERWGDLEGRERESDGSSHFPTDACRQCDAMRCDAMRCDSMPPPTLLLRRPTDRTRTHCCTALLSPQGSPFSLWVAHIGCSFAALFDTVLPQTVVAHYCEQ